MSVRPALGPLRPVIESTGLNISNDPNLYKKAKLKPSQCSGVAWDTWGIPGRFAGALPCALA